jgi:hypothetical protein
MDLRIVTGTASGTVDTPICVSQAISTNPAENVIATAERGHVG